MHLLGAQMGEMWLYSYAVQTLPFGAAHPVRKMRTTAEQSALTRSQASLQPRFAWLAKVARRGEISNAISKNFVGYCVGCEHLWCVWKNRFWGKRKGWKPLLRLGFQPLLSSVIFRYFLLKSDGVLRLENRLPKRHRGSHTPPEDRRARSSGSEAAWGRQKTTECCFSPSVTEPQREQGVGIFVKDEYTPSKPALQIGIWRFI